MCIKYKIIECNNKEEFKEVIKDDTISSMYGDLNSSNRFCLIEIAKLNFKVGVAYYFEGPDLKVFLAQDGKTLFVGYNSEVVVLDCEKGKELFYHEDLAPFCDFIVVDAKNYLVAVFELTIFILSYQGEILYSTGVRDMVIDYQLITDDILLIKTDDGVETCYNIADGKGVTVI